MLQAQELLQGSLLDDETLLSRLFSSAACYAHRKDTEQGKQETHIHSAESQPTGLAAYCAPRRMPLVMLSCMWVASAHVLRLYLKLSWCRRWDQGSPSWE